MKRFRVTSQYKEDIMVVLSIMKKEKRKGSFLKNRQELQKKGIL